MAEVVVEVKGLDEIQAGLKNIPFWLFGAAEKEVKRSTLSIRRGVTKNFKRSSDMGGNKLHSRTDALRLSIKTATRGTTLNTLRGSVFSDSIYAPIHEHGGTVKAKDKYLRVPGGPYLNIPLPSNKTPAGVMRKNARTVFNEGGYIMRSARGNYIVMSGINEPMFILRKKVEIPARLGMVKAAEDEIPTMLGRINSLNWRDAL